MELHSKGWQVFPMGLNKQMRIGISFNPYGHSYGRYGNQAYARLKEHGYNAVDFNIADTNTALYTLNQRDLKQTITAQRLAAQKAHVTISQVHGPWRWPPQDGTEAQRAERLEKMKKATVITALLGCHHLVIHPIMPYGVEDGCCGKEQETWALNVAFFRELADFAALYGVIICLENMPMHHFSLSTPQRILELVTAIRHDHVRVCLDTGHVAVFPELSVGDEVRRLGDAIRVLHIHDNLGDRDSHLYPGDGRIDWADFGRALEEVGYDGVLSLETQPSGALDDRRFAEESIRLNRLFRALLTDED